MAERKKEEYSEEDLDKVNSYLNSPIHRKERKPFKPMRLLVMLIVVVTSLQLLSLYFASLVQH